VKRGAIPETGGPQSTGLLAKILDAAKASFRGGAGAADDAANSGQNITARVGFGMQVGSSAGQAGVAAVGAVSSFKQADYLEQQGKLEAAIIELQELIKQLQKIVDAFLNGNLDLSEWTNAITDQIGKTLQGWSQQITGLSQATSSPA